VNPGSSAIPDVFSAMAEFLSTVPVTLELKLLPSTSKTLALPSLNFALIESLQTGLHPVPKTPSLV
jgi:hypothetical protein